jgi:hypothetical protein
MAWKSNPLAAGLTAAAQILFKKVMPKAQVKNDFNIMTHHVITNSCSDLNRHLYTLPMTVSSIYCFMMFMVFHRFYGFIYF